jgi:cholesterol transport system auxiliary component
MTGAAHLIRRMATIAALGVATIGLVGCVTLLPKTKPVQLYHLGLEAQAGAEAAAKAAAKAAAVPVLQGAIQFNRDIAGDRLLTRQGDQAAYVADARWTMPASLMFEESLANAFMRGSGDARLISAKDPVSAKLILRLDVRALEVRYSEGSRRSPLAAVIISGLLADADKRTIVSQSAFDCQVPAKSNRVQSLVSAMNDALSDCQTKVVAWTDQTAARAAKPKD